MPDSRNLKTYINEPSLKKMAFEDFINLSGQVYRQQKNRTTSKVVIGNAPYFIKTHLKLGWLNWLLSILKGHHTKIGAESEWKAIKALEKLQVDTMTIAAYGHNGQCPPLNESFILTESLENTESLEDYTRDWKNTKPAHKEKRALIKRLAEISRTLHNSGINHRDYYLCHFLKPNDATDKLHLIDLHRVQIRKSTPIRWQIKDLSSLYFSAMHIPLTQNDCFYFMRIYEQRSLKEIMHDNLKFWQTVNQKANALYQKGVRKGIV